jgi:hypothetical protein
MVVPMPRIPFDGGANAPVREHSTPGKPSAAQSVGCDESADSSGPATNATTPIYAQSLCYGGVVCSPSAFAGHKMRTCSGLARHRTESRSSSRHDRRTSATPAGHLACAAVVERAPIRQCFEIERALLHGIFPHQRTSARVFLLAMRGETL